MATEEVAADAVPEAREASEVPEEAVPEGSDNILALVHVLDAELDIGTSPVIILYYRIADIERIASLDIVVKI